ncbi:MULTISPECIES: RNA polymerase subunit sigma-70 [Bacillus]|uniref:RNA polymerase subunit sigma-70 n=1 Tax=Bacillus TaxID=1386 RepID=UPI000BB8825A|nr:MULTISPECIES: RNA polymerase subunit sigma-70 [Bacillus]
MKYGDKHSHSYGKKDVFGVSFHDFLEKEKDSSYVELASEFGLTVRDVRTIKKQINRSY